MRERPRSLIFVFLLSSFFPQSGGDQEIVIGSKKFTESVILGEILTQVSQFEGFSAIHKQQLGGTQILWNALLAGEIDMYPDYTGTLMRETLSELRLKNESELRQVLLSKGIGMTEPIGFNNTYAMGIKKATWQRLNINKISDLQNYPGLKFGFSNELGSSTTPRLSLGAELRPLKWLSLLGGTSVGGYEGFQWGSGISMRLLFLQFAFSYSEYGGMLKSAKGFSLSASTALVF